MEGAAFRTGGMGARRSAHQKQLSHASALYLRWDPGDPGPRDRVGLALLGIQLSIPAGCGGSMAETSA